MRFISYLCRNFTDMCTVTLNNDTDYSIEIDSDVYNQDFDYANPGIQDEETPETDIQFE